MQDPKPGKPTQHSHTQSPQENPKIQNREKEKKMMMEQKSSPLQTLCNLRHRYPDTWWIAASRRIARIRRRNYGWPRLGLLLGATNAVDLSGVGSRYYCPPDCDGGFVEEVDNPPSRAAQADARRERFPVAAIFFKAESSASKQMQREMRWWPGYDAAVAAGASDCTEGAKRKAQMLLKLPVAH
ncbi:hypothetical protein NE237_029084 [Protea cynaroides]|uniref:Uncharacterized protein n=1 Tax=Protea cynaroides TaxID=273540 RepID=A0A9Q0GQJ3_9MAGN|nr:hypothetical protein NE237_029084 [Protea cynaroides]